MEREVDAFKKARIELEDGKKDPHAEAIKHSQQSTTQKSCHGRSYVEPNPED